MAITVRAIGTFAQQASGNSTIVVSLPAGTVSGDVLVAFLGTRTLALTAPAGWTKIAGGTQGDIDSWGHAYYRVAGGSEPASYTWTGLPTTGNRAMARMVSFIGVDNTTVLAGTMSERANASGVSGTTAMTTTAANAVVVSFAVTAQNTSYSAWTVGGNAMAEQFDNGAGTGYTKTIGAATYTQVSAGSTGASAVTPAANALNYALLFALNPAITFVTHDGAAALTGTGSSSTDGTVTRLGASGLTGTGALSATGERTALGTAALSGTGTLDATGGLLQTGEAALSGTGLITATGVSTVPGAAAISGAGALSATGVSTVPGAAQLSSTGALSAQGTTTAFGESALSGSGDLTADGEVTTPEPTTVFGSASLTGAGFLTVVRPSDEPLHRGGFWVSDKKRKPPGILRTSSEVVVTITATSRPIGVRWAGFTELKTAVRGTPRRAAYDTRTAVAVTVRTAATYMDSDEDIAALLTLMEKL